MKEKLQALAERYATLTERIADPAVMADQAEWRKLVQEHARLEPIVQKFEELERVEAALADAEAMQREKLDDEMRELVRQELAELRPRLEQVTQELKVLLLPTDPNDEKNVVMEIRAGTGGEEAALFAADLARMYMRFTERQGWRTETLSVSESETGGFKEIIFTVEGHGAYSRLKFESGVHRVQRVPETEAQGRIHTSTATVAVLPEAEDVEVHIEPKDLQIDTYRASGAGGQHVNKTESAIRITHLPTGLVVTCQDEKSQIKNREKAMRVLRARLYELEQAQQAAQLSEARRAQVGGGERSEKIRTYNFPQNRVTDHRIGLTLHRLEALLDGELTELIEALITNDQAERLKQAGD